jgi:putative membrane protein
MKNVFRNLSMIAIVISLGSCASSKSDSVRVAMEQNKKLDKKSRCDAKFAVCASDVHELETKLAKLAQTKAVNAEVKQFATTVANEHSKSNEELKAIAVKNNIVMPSGLSERGQKAYDHFAKKEGEKFDKSYLKCTAKTHKKQACKYKKEAKKGNVAEVKNYASNKVPVLKQHREMAKTTCKQVKKK